MSEPFQLPRQQRRPHGDSRATADDLTFMENRIMAALEDAVNNLRQAVSDAQSRFSVAGDVQAAVQAERDRYDALVAAENAEDAQQDQALADAKAETDRLLGEINSAAQSLTQVTDQVNSLGQVAQDQPTQMTAADADQPTADADQPTADADQPAVATATETTTATDTSAQTMAELQPEATTPGDTPADVGTTSAPADADAAGASEATPVDTGAAPSQVSDEPAVGPSAVDNAADNPETSSDPTDVSNLRPNI
jgi:uncharacterized phage infection (PIP) family protein YhgE